MPFIDRSSSTPFYEQVYEQIARGIEEGFYPAGSKLLSIRECARELAVSNTTIELAYQRLTEEGYVEARRGSGYTVCTLPSDPSIVSQRFAPEYQEALEQLSHAIGELSECTEETVRWDFAYDAVDPSVFPYATWARISRDVFFDYGAEAACLYNDPQGLYELREQISHYIGREYGISASPNQILVMPTTRDLVSDIMALFDPASTTVAMEEPGYDEVATKLANSGYKTKFMTLHPTPAWEDLERQIAGVRIVFTTPASQFPSNVPMTSEIRKAFVNWADENNAYILDDEYGWEFQSGIDRTPPLAALDHAGRIITLGTFSHSFTPAVCLSYAVLPPQLMLKWRMGKIGSHPKAPWQTQAAMATFMREEHWHAHIRKVRTSMAKKRTELLRSIEAHLGDSIQMLEGVSSSFVLAQTVDERSEAELIELAQREGVRVYPTRRYWNGPMPDDWRYVQIGFAGIALEQIEPGIRALAKAWKR